MRTPTRLWIASFAMVVGLALAVSAAGGRQESPFPHEDHEGLFPVCAGCHAGVPDGNTAEFYPEPAQCVGCHDGQEEERVTWNGPSSRSSNVVFDHREHAAELQAASDPEQTCETCHSSMDGGRMSVDESEELESCWSCHAHERVDHFAVTGAGDCTVCHVPMAETSFDRVRIEALPAPVDHDGTEFLLDRHAAELESDPARCATCHTADRCVACHVDGPRSEITQIPAAPVGMEQPAWGAVYPTPSTHEVSDFSVVHGPSTSDASECATCHTSDDCVTCHVGFVPESATALPARADVRAPGAALEVVAPGTHDSFFFMSAHSNLAAAEPGTCATCHTETYCVDCHDGPSDGGYHPGNFVAQHSADAFGRAEECATCHSTAAFCRECHQESGLESVGRLGAGYHDAEPLFLLRHGQAARQSLESCASCHQQTDCVQCHGVLGAFKVSPHTDDFDARAAWARSPRTCMACHISNPVGGLP